jgi:2-polyprenyl-3-methyl-5-hydroxy-6-metoxy-1,4-benzoquinol methylase
MEVAWNEADIHDVDGDAHADVLEKNAVFQLFDTVTEDDEPLEFNFQNMDIIVLHGKTQCTNSTGLSVWLGAEIMAEYLARNPATVRGKSVLELGAGLGLCSLIAHRLGAARVISTDGDINVLKKLRTNVGNSGIEACPQLIWGKDLQQFEETFGKFQVIIATDCGYISRSIRPMWRTVSQLLSNEGIFLYVNVCSSQFKPEFFVEEATRQNFTWDGPVDEVYLFRRK